MRISMRLGVMLMILGLVVLQAHLSVLSAHTEDAEIYRRIDDLRRELDDKVDDEFERISEELKWRDTSLSWRGRSIDRWLVVLGIIITVFAVVIAVLAACGFYEFRKLKNQAQEITTDIEAAKNTAEKAAKKAQKAAEITDNIKDAKDTAEKAAKKAQKAANKANAAARRASLEQKGSDIDLSRRPPLEEPESISVPNANSDVTASHEGHMTGSHEADSFYEAAGTKLKHHDYRGAISDFDRVIDLNPDYAGGYNGRGFAKKMLGQYDTAREDFDAAVRRNPHYVRAYINRGLANASRGDTEAAKADWSRALDLAEQQGLTELIHFIKGLLRDI